TAPQLSHLLHFAERRRMRRIEVQHAQFAFGTRLCQFLPARLPRTVSPCDGRASESNIKAAPCDLPLLCLGEQCVGIVRSAQIPVACRADEVAIQGVRY